jgi:hypothetical protein
VNLINAVRNLLLFICGFSPGETGIATEVKFEKSNSSSGRNKSLGYKSRSL